MSGSCMSTQEQCYPDSQATSTKSTAVAMPKNIKQQRILVAAVVALCLLQLIAAAAPTSNNNNRPADTQTTSPWERTLSGISEGLQFLRSSFSLQLVPSRPPTRVKLGIVGFGRTGSTSIYHALRVFATRPCTITNDWKLRI